MNQAQRHIDKAASYVEKGEAYYSKAAEEIVAARFDGATWTEINDGLGRGDKYAQRIVTWAETPANDRARAPFGGIEENARKAAGHAKSVLRDAPLEQVERIVASLPKERQQAIASAAGHGYLKARQEQDEADRRRTPAEQREREEARESLSRPVRQATGGFVSLGIIGHLEQATEELRELNADASLTPQAAKKIERALDAFVIEFNFAKALLGEEGN